jgi:omega-6 fatty acid desaturase (delta-12 desaturase)
MSAAFADRPVRISDAVKTIPAPCRERSTARGVLVLARDLGSYAVAIALLTSDHPLSLIVGWPLAGITIASLFVLGHDAAHGALFDSPRLCRIVGRLAMLPSLHAYAPWAYGHNRVHHAFATCGGLDAVWHPMTPTEWESASPLRRLLHRLEWSCVGAGPYYARAIWWRQLVRAAAPRGQQAAFRRDRQLVLAYFLLFSAILVGLGIMRYGSVLGVGWIWVKVFAGPWLLWNVLIGWTVYLHHIHPSIRWAQRGRWTKVRGQIEGTTELAMPRWVDFVSHNIFHHVAHHVDPRIPFYHLPAASRALRRRFGATIPARSYDLRDYGRITRRCKLFDFDREVWLRYPRRASRRSW